MRDYRLYVMSLTSDHIDDFADVEAANDEDAIRMANMFARSRRSELWCRSRLVRAWVPGALTSRRSEVLAH